MSPVMLIDEWPNRSATALMCRPDSSQPTAPECRNVCTPTRSTPAAKALASLLDRLRSASAQGRRGNLAVVRTMTEKGDA